MRIQQFLYRPRALHSLRSSHKCHGSLIERRETYSVEVRVALCGIIIGVYHHGQ